MKNDTRNSLVLLLLPLLLACGCTGALGLSNSEPVDTTKLDENHARHDAAGDHALLSAFYGLDDALPLLGRLVICRSTTASDGMPVVFSEELDLETLQAGDFRVELEDGSAGQIACVTPAPASDPGEFRTILLLGDFGSAENQPTRVEIRGNLLSRDHRINFRGRGVDVTRLEEGPSLLLAEVVPPGEWDLERTPSRFPWGGGSGCPAETRQVVRVVWSGGVTRPGGDEVGDAERRAYRVITRGDGAAESAVTPIAIGDLGDGDNNHELCLDTEREVLRVEFPAGLMTDPREDLNPATAVEMRPGKS